MTHPSVMIFCARTTYVEEARAIVEALAQHHGLASTCIGADLCVAAAVPRIAADNVEQVSAGVRDRLMAIGAVEAAMNAVAAWRCQTAVARLLQSHAPAAIVIFDDRLIRPDAIVLREAMRLGIPVVLAPYAATSREADRFVRLGKAKYSTRAWGSSIAAAVVARRYPAQVSDGTLFYPAAVTLALGSIGELPPRPWVLGAGGADVVCVLGPDHYDNLVEEGLPKDRIAITGQASTDVMVLSTAAREQLSRRLRAKYSLASDAPIVCCAVPQHAEHGMADWAKHTELTDRLLKGLAGSGAAILLSLHPKSKREFYEPMALKHGLKILDERLSNTLAAADVLVAAFSSTVRWAIGLGIPAIVIDDLASGYKAFREIPGVDVVDNADSLAHELGVLVEQPHALSAKRRDAHSGADRLGKIDGTSGARIAAIIAGFASSRMGAGSAAQPSAANFTTFKGASR